VSTWTVVVAAGSGTRFGGDKQLPYFKTPPEPNPALGWRGLRLTLEWRDLLQVQLRAVMRASAFDREAVGLPLTDGADLARAVLQAPAGEGSAGASVEVLFQERFIRVLADGSTLHRHHQIFRIHGEDALEAMKVGAQRVETKLQTLSSLVPAE